MTDAPSPRWRPLRELPPGAWRDVVGVFTDIDDTLTTDGAITPDALSALAELRAAGVHVIAVFQVLIYVGAVMVFMVYVIMLLDVRDPAFLERYGRAVVPSNATRASDRWWFGVVPVTRSGIAGEMVMSPVVTIAGFPVITSVTPPYGLCLLISCAVAKVRLTYALKDTMIMLVPMLLVLVGLVIWPEIVLFLPKLISPELVK